MSSDPVVIADSHSQPRISRSRSSSVTGPATPESQYSDTPPSSDPDTHIPPYLTSFANKPLFTMEIDTASNAHLMNVDSDVSYDAELGVPQARGLQGLSAFRPNFEDPIFNGLPSLNPNTKTDILMLEEILQDGAFDPPAPAGSPFQSYPSLSLAFRDSSIPPSSTLNRHAEPSPQPDLLCIDPSSTQHVQSQTKVPSPSRLSTTVTSSSSSNSSSNSDPPGVLLLSPDTRPAQDVSMPPKTEDPSLYSFGPKSFASISNNVVRPPKEGCVDLPIFFPSIPVEGAKSRVETQIKLTFELGYPTPPSPMRHPQKQSNPVPTSPHPTSSYTLESPEASPSFCKREASGSDMNSLQPLTHDRVGSYLFIRLPQGTATKRRTTVTKSSNRSSDVTGDETLELTAEVVCCSPPHARVQSCSSCQSREAKRTARKVAARVRPSRPKSKAKKTLKKGKEQEINGAETAETDEETEEEPNADTSIIQFNCSEIVDFRGGSVVLPMRITCYCRHHKEKIGFNIVFTLRDCLGRVVGRGTTPPILITDDHKSNNAVSKLPPMHPLRHSLNPPSQLQSSPLSSENHEDIKQEIDQDSGRMFTKRRERDLMAKRQRPKPYDGRPMSRISGIGPGIQGRQGVVLALHPVHARAQDLARNGSRSGTSLSSSRATSVSRDAESPTSPVVRARSSSPPVLPEDFLPSALPPGHDVALALESGPALPRHGSSPSLTSFLPTTPPTPSSMHSPVSSNAERQMMHPSMQSLPDLQALSSPFSPLMSPPNSFVPRIHRLIPSSGPTTGGIEITVLGTNFDASMNLECVFGGMVASSTHRWSDNTLVCILPPRATPGLVSVEFKGMKVILSDESGACLFNYVDESDRQLMELALQVVGLKMTGKIEEARNIAMRIVGDSSASGMPGGESSQLNPLSGAQFSHSFLASLGGMDLETLVIKLLTLLDVPREDGAVTPSVIEHQNATGQTLLHLAVMLALPSLVSCLAQRSVDLDVRNNNGLTALHFAAMTGWKEGAKILLAAGADVSIVDYIGFTPVDWARCAGSHELEDTLLDAIEREKASERGSGEEGDDEAWCNVDDVSDDGASDAGSSLPITAPPQYTARSRGASFSLSGSSSDVSRFEERRRTELPERAEATAPADPHVDEKKRASFVERFNLPQGILPNVQLPGLAQLQLPGFSHLQLPDKLTGPWVAFPQIPVFPVFVPIPHLPHLRNWPTFPWTDGEKKGSSQDGEHGEKHQQQAAFATLWTAYDNIANNAWRTQWEKWTAQIAALQNVYGPSTEEPPKYTPREQSQQSEDTDNTPAAAISGDDVRKLGSSDSATESAPVMSTHRPATKSTPRRMGYSPVNVSDTEVDLYHYQPKMKANHKKRDHMLILFWIPILFIGIAYAFYTTVPVALAGVSRATRRLIPPLAQRDNSPG